MKVLVIDDDDTVRTIARLCLETVGGMEVVEASDGETGVRLAAEELPDGIVLDAVMPGMDGVATLAALTADSATARIPVVVMTAFQDASETAEFRRVGVAGIVHKPFDPMTLADELRSLFDGQSRSR